ncbi:MAG: hypothetical protein ACI86H_003021, partial [bacterium]
MSEEFVVIVEKLDYDLNNIRVNLNQIAKSINSRQVYHFGSSERGS